MSDVAVAPQRSSADPPTAGTARPLPRRVGLPTSRAVVGGFLVALSALGIFATYSRAAAGPSTAFVVARHDIPAGARLTADDLVLLPMELPTVVVESAVFSSEEAVAGATAVGPIRRGELVQAGDVVRKRSAPEELELSFSIDPARALAGTLRGGERIDVLATFGSGADTYTVTVVRQARVLDVRTDRGALAATATVVSVALSSSDEALALTHALNAGDVTLVRSTGSTVSGPVGQTYTAPATADEG